MRGFGNHAEAILSIDCFLITGRNKQILEGAPQLNVHVRIICLATVWKHRLERSRLKSRRTDKRLSVEGGRR